MENEMKSQVQAVLQAIKTKSFVAGYEATDEEAMGLLVSKFFEWDGVAILKVAEGALEDANFHGESAKVGEMIEAITNAK